MSERKISFWHPASLICTVFGVGKIRPAPGTWGSLAGIVFFGISPSFAIIACVPLFILGVIAANIYTNKTQKEDASEIVIDEVVGQWVTIITMFVLSFIIGIFSPINNEPATIIDAILFVSVPFITFRIFDIVKKGPVGWVDRNVKGGLGVMLDDVVAGILAGLTSALLFFIIA